MTNGQCQPGDTSSAVRGDVIALTKGERSPRAVPGWVAVGLCRCHASLVPFGLPKLLWGSSTIWGWDGSGVGAGSKRVSWELLQVQGALHGAAGEDTGPGSLRDAVMTLGPTPFPLLRCALGFSPPAPPWRWVWTQGVFLLSCSGRQECAGSSSLHCWSCLASLTPWARWQCCQHRHCPKHPSVGLGTGS